MKAIKLLGVEGKKVNIMPIVGGMNITDLYFQKAPTFCNMQKTLLIGTSGAVRLLRKLKKKTNQFFSLLVIHHAIGVMLWKKRVLMIWM